MEKRDYKDILIQTVNETYPKYFKHNLIKQFEKESLVYCKNSSIHEADAIDLRGIDEDRQLEKCINKSDEIIKEIEKKEILGRFRYAAFFDIHNLNFDDLESLIKEMKILDPETNEFENDKLFPVIDSSAVPTKYKMEGNMIVLKFNRLLTGYAQIDDDSKRSIKYNVLAIIYKDLNVLEIRFDSVKSFLNNDGEFFYVKQVEAVLDWISENFGCELEALNLEPIVEKIKKNTEFICDKGQRKVTLEIGDNEENILPILGELKELMKSNQDLFNNSTEMKNLLEDFILETEAITDLPWLTLTCKDGSKLKAAKVRFDFNYKRQEYSLLKYCWNDKMKTERMNNVARYLIKNRVISDEECVNEALEK